MEELDSDDEEEEPDDDPLADAALMVRKLIQNASNKTSDVHARAQQATEEYKCAPHIPRFFLYTRGLCCTGGCIVSTLLWLEVCDVVVPVWVT